MFFFKSSIQKLSNYATIRLALFSSSLAIYVKTDSISQISRKMPKYWEKTIYIFFNNIFAPKFKILDFEIIVFSIF